VLVSARLDKHPFIMAGAELLSRQTPLLIEQHRIGTCFQFKSGAKEEFWKAQHRVRAIERGRGTVRSISKIVPIHRRELLREERNREDLRRALQAIFRSFSTCSLGLSPSLPEGIGY
jgi:hypothetical protein